MFQEWWNAKWFIPVKNENTKEDDWKYVGNYWVDNFEDVRDIFFGDDENLEKKWFCFENEKNSDLPTFL